MANNSNCLLSVNQLMYLTLNDSIAGRLAPFDWIALMKGFDKSENLTLFFRLGADRMLNMHLTIFYI